MNRGARATAEQIPHAGRTGDIDTFLDLMAPDAHLGHAEIRAHLTAVGESLHETADPEIIIAEYAAHGATGASFPQQVIAVLQVRVGGGGEDPR